MSKTKRRADARRPWSGRIRPSFDRLETRSVLSGLDTGFLHGLETISDVSGASGSSSAEVASPVSSVDPAPDSVVATSPQALTVSFSRPINPFSPGVADFRLDRLGNDGSISSISLFEELDPDDPTGSRFRLTPDQALEDGRYRLVLAADNFLMTDDGQFISTGGSDLELSTFTVGRRPWGGVADAIDIDPATPAGVSASGSLDLSADPNAVILYRLTVPEGHHWQLGLSLKGPDGEPPFPSLVSLFDAQGTLIAIAGGDQGGSDLLQDVSPGTYLVGISASGNVPGEPGGYDPARAIEGSSAVDAVGGAFRLDYEVTSLDPPTQVTGLTLDRGDAYSTVPTGLTISFSAPLDVRTLLTPDSNSLVLVDDSGATWDVKPVGYDESPTRLALLFDRALPEGRYTLKTIEGGHLVDTAGLVPEATGEAEGVLGTFEIEEGLTSPDDLGALLPGIAKEGVAAEVEVAPGDSIVKHFVVFDSGIYSILGVGGKGGLDYSLKDADGNSIKLPGAKDGSAEAKGYLAAGSYTLELSNSGSSTVEGSIAVLLRHSLNSSLLLGAVAQAPAQNVQVTTPPLRDPVTPTPVTPSPVTPSPVTPTPVTPTPTTPSPVTPSPVTQTPFAPSPVTPTPVTPVTPTPVTPTPVTPTPTPMPANTTASGIYPQPSSASPGGGSSTSATNPGPAHEPVATSSPSSASLYDLDLGLLGRPSPAAQQISVVGPAGPSGSVALAFNSQGPPGGAVVVPQLPLRKFRVSGPVSNRAAWDREIPTEPLATAGEVDYGLISRDRELGVDDKILTAAAAWVDRMAALGLDRLEFLASRPSAPTAQTVEPTAVASLAGPTEILAEGPASPLDSPRVETASIAPIVGSGVLALMAYRYWHRIKTRSNQTRKVELKPLNRDLYRGLHKRIRVLR